MELDIQKYTETFDKFLVQMSAVSEPFLPEFQTILTDICELLRIGRIEVCQYETAYYEKINNGENYIYYDCANADESTCLKRRERSGRGNVIVYKVYQKNGDEKWKEQETEKIQLLLTMLFVFNGRSRAVNFVKNTFFYDQDLNIYNIRFFKKMVTELLEVDEHTDYAACYFNLKRFSVINQKLGRNGGTEVMKKFLLGLQEKIGSNGYVCRIARDNFVALFEKKYIDVVIDYLNGQWIVCSEATGEKVFVTTSAGYYKITDNIHNADDVMDRISAAVRAARKNVNKTYVFYDEQLKKEVEHAKLIESSFEAAIENEEFAVYYQPKVLLKDYSLAGAEALCRWRHNGTIVPPNDFIPILEQSNAICTLDFYVLEHVCRDIRKWLDEGQQVVRVSVNLSRRHMGDTELVKRIMSIIDKYSVPHKYIEIELTETTTDVNFEDLKSVVEELSEHGISTSVDDFGIGYSSLNLIRQVPWNIIKIDKSLLPVDAKSDQSQYSMLRHLITMLQDMGFKCIVEGVETVEQVKMLKENNCYLAQGFCFDRPLPHDEFEKRLDALNDK